VEIIGWGTLGKTTANHGQSGKSVHCYIHRYRVRSILRGIPTWVRNRSLFGGGGGGRREISWPWAREEEGETHFMEFRSSLTSHTWSAAAGPSIRSQLWEEMQHQKAKGQREDMQLLNGNKFRIQRTAITKIRKTVYTICLWSADTGESSSFQTDELCVKRIHSTRLMAVVNIVVWTNKELLYCITDCTSYIVQSFLWS
jgi:hypothetical protein